jgi:hypothetical protein
MQAAGCPYRRTVLPQRTWLSSARFCAQNHEQDVHVTHRANLKLRGDALAPAPLAEHAARFLGRQALEEAESEQLPGGLEAAIDTDGGSERCQSLVYFVFPPSGVALV